MQIKHIQSENFKGNTNVSITPEKVNILVGQNGAGETSLLEAIRFAITGKSPDDYKRAGTVSGSVSVNMADIGEIRREWTPEKSIFKLNGKTTTSKAIAEQIQAVCGISSTTTNILSSSEVVAALSSGELSEYLLTEGFLKSSVDIEKIIAFCKLSPAAEEELRMQLSPAPEVIPLEFSQ